MEKERQRYYEKMLHEEIAPALGCTEPAAAALACAYAAKALGEKPEKLMMEVSPYIFKNGMNVGIPGTNLTGLLIAGALGAVEGNPEKELLVLQNLGEDKKKEAEQMVNEKRIEIRLASDTRKIYIRAIAKRGRNTGEAIIAENHKRLILLRKNQEILFEAEGGTEPGEISGQEAPYTVKTEEIVAFAKEIPLERLEFLKEVIRVNRGIAKEGLAHAYGLGVGRQMLAAETHGLIQQDAANYAAALTAAAADARMAGCEKPVMSTAGSGNQGLTATVPLIALSEKLEIEEERLLRALVISILLTVHTKHYLGKLSVLCGCSISAAMGVACGIIDMLGGTFEQMHYALNTMTADISGVVCDGAKSGCALKIATAVNSAVRAANMALNGIGANQYDGIVHQDVEKTLENLGTLGNVGMQGTNDIILQMLLKK